MTIFFPDVSHYNDPLNLSGVPFVWAKATEGTTFTDPAYHSFVVQAQTRRIPYGAYHFLRAADPMGQARHALAVVGEGVPLFVDVERATGDPARPTVSTVTSFVTEYRRVGGTCHMVYLPVEYWRDVLGSPDLRPLSKAGVFFINAWYTTYSNNGPGWGTYGGIQPAQWQYTSGHMLNGKAVDWNAYRGTLDEYLTMINGGSVMAGLTDAEQHELLRLVRNAERGVAWEATYDTDIPWPSPWPGGPAKSPNPKAQILAAIAAIPASGTPTDAQVDAAMLKAMSDPQLVDKIGQALWKAIRAGLAGQ